MNQLVAQILELAIHGGEDGPVENETPQPEKYPAAVELGRRGGLKGGKARAEKLSPERRKEIAKQAAEKRWGNRTEAT
jgi:hypothetical protein